MAEIRSLEDLKSYKPKQELIIKEKFITDDNYIRATTLIDMSKEENAGLRATLKGEIQTLEVPVLEADSLIMNDFLYITPKGRRYEFKDGYANVVRLKKDFVKAHLACIVQEFGVIVKKEGDERFPTPIILHTEEYYLWYSFRHRTWKLLKEDSDIADWFEIKSQIDALTMQSDELNGINKKFESLRKLNLEYAGSYKEQIDLFFYALTATKAFFTYQNLFCKVNDVHYRLILNECDQLLKKTKTLEAALRPEFEHVGELSRLTLQLQRDISKTNTAFADVRLAIQKFVQQRGYWIDHQQGEIYPNPAEYYALKTFATKTRNNETKSKLKRAILDRKETKIEESVITEIEEDLKKTEKEKK